MRKRVKLFFSILGGLALVILGYFFIGWPTKGTDTAYGVTWSKTYADYLGIDPQAGLKATVEDLGVKYFRIPVYWTEVEPQQGQFHFDWLKAQLDEIAVHGGKAILVVGAKQPRWPECWVPDWAKALATDKKQEAQLTYVKTVFDVFASHPAVLAWQVENEPGFAFGTCDHLDRVFTDREIAAVKQMERITFSADKRHPVYTTASGEWSAWLDYAGKTDGIGISTYRVVRLSSGMIFSYFFLPPWSYARKAAIASIWAGPIFVSEMQMEPWMTHGLADPNDPQMTETMDISRMKSNLAFASEMHMSSVYFWGAEWWYWMKVKGNHAEYWDTMKAFFAGN